MFKSENKKKEVERIKRKTFFFWVNFIFYFSYSTVTKLLFSICLSTIFSFFLSYKKSSLMFNLLFFLSVM